MTGTVPPACLCRDPGELPASWLMAPLCFAPTPAAGVKGRVSFIAVLVSCFQGIPGFMFPRHSWVDDPKALLALCSQGISDISFQAGVLPPLLEWSASEASLVQLMIPASNALTVHRMEAVSE